jgi:peptide chain release factor 1
MRLLTADVCFRRPICCFFSCQDIEGFAMREMLEQKLNRFEELENQLNDPAIQSDSKKIAAVAREHGSLVRLATKYRHFKGLIDEINELQKMAQSQDSEEREMAEAELPTAKERREKVWLELLDMTVGGEDANRSRCIMEIRAGTGGDEAALFAHDLFQMYQGYAETKGWMC